MSGAFGDIGTGLPLIIGILLVSALIKSVCLSCLDLPRFSQASFTWPLCRPAQFLKTAAIMAISMNLDRGLILVAGIGLGVVM